MGSSAAIVVFFCLFVLVWFFVFWCFFFYILILIIHTTWKSNVCYWMYMCSTFCQFLADFRFLCETLERKRTFCTDLYDNNSATTINHNNLQWPTEVCITFSPMSISPAVQPLNSWTSWTFGEVVKGMKNNCKVARQKHEVRSTRRHACLRAACATHRRWAEQWAGLLAVNKTVNGNI